MTDVGRALLTSSSSFRERIPPALRQLMLPESLRWVLGPTPQKQAKYLHKLTGRVPPLKH